jgi:hypothetical protein
VVLLFYNSFSLALFQAAQKLDACFLIDDELAFSFADGLFGAHLYAESALDAIVGYYDHLVQVSSFLGILASLAAGPSYSDLPARQPGASPARVALDRGRLPQGFTRILHLRPQMLWWQPSSRGCPETQSRF